jgi:hypothetical protein
LDIHLLERFLDMENVWRPVLDELSTLAQIRAQSAHFAIGPK